MPVAFSPKFVNQVIPLINKETEFKKKAVQKKFINNFENQWIEYVVKSLSKVGDVPFNNYAKSLMEGTNNLAKKI